MSKSKTRNSFWDASKREAYDKISESTKQNFVDQREGQQIADNLQEYFEILGEEESAFLEYLLLIKRRVVIALNEEDLFKKLYDAGFLQIPPGVGVLFRRYNQTTYSIPIAVWNSLINADQQKLFKNFDDTEDRRQKLFERFAHRIDATVKSDDGFIELPKI